MENKKKALKETFSQALSKSGIPMTNDLYGDAEENVYKEMVRKLCNIRIEGFLSSQKQKIASEKGTASTTGQNLRDKLLTQHTNLQCQIKVAK